MSEQMNDLLENHEEKNAESEETDLLRDKRGAVLAEFVVAIIPLLTIFFVFVQISAIAAARLRFKHAAVVGARSAAVFSNKYNNCPECQGDGESEINAAVKAGLGGLSQTMSGVSATITDRSSERDPYGLVTVEVNGNYKCNVPLGKIICGADGMVPFQEKKSMPHQGALYKL